MKIESWSMPQGLRDELDAHYKAKLALRLKKDDSPMSVIHAVTFDGVASNLALSDVERFLDFVDAKFLSYGIMGVGLEVGSGPGTFSALLAKRSRVEKMYAVDGCGSLVRELMPAVVSHILPGTAGDKVVGVVGDFDHVELPDASVDFVFDFYSLHHSVDLGATLREACRILKPGGFVLCFDKARHDGLSDRDLEALLDIEYPDAVKRSMGVDPAVKHTRRMNGEKEYRLRDWRRHFLENGFQEFEHFHVAAIRNKNPLVKAAKTVFSLLPPRLQVRMADLLPLKPQNDMSPSHRVYTPLLAKFPKEISLMIAYKKAAHAS